MAKDEEKDENEDENKEEKEDKKISRSLQVQTATVCIEITSEDKNDTLEKMRDLVEYFYENLK